MERCAKQGLKGMLGVATGGLLAVQRREYDPLWRVSSEADMPLSLHKSLFRQAGRASIQSNGDRRHSCTPCGRAMLTTIIFGGVLERFPQLMIVSAENDIGWFPN